MANKVNKLAILMALDRSGDKQLQLSVDEYLASDGGKPRYVSVGLHGKKEDGTFQDLRSGCTVRRGEIKQLISALERAYEIMETPMDSLTLSHSEYAKTLDWGSQDVRCLPVEEMLVLAAQCRQIQEHGWAEQEDAINT